MTLWQEAEAAAEKKFPDGSMTTHALVLTFRDVYAQGYLAGAKKNSEATS